MRLFRISNGWTYFTIGRYTICIYKMPVWGVMFSRKRADGWEEVIWPRD